MDLDFTIVDMCSCGKAILRPPGYCTYCRSVAPEVTDKDREAFWKKYTEECRQAKEKADAERHIPSWRAGKVYEPTTGEYVEAPPEDMLGRQVQFQRSKATGKLWRANHQKGCYLVIGEVVYWGPALDLKGLGSFDEPPPYNPDQWKDKRVWEDLRSIWGDETGLEEFVPLILYGVERADHAVIRETRLGEHSETLYYHLPQEYFKEADV